jgi:hypothetical protein
MAQTTGTMASAPPRTVHTTIPPPTVAPPTVPVVQAAPDFTLSAQAFYDEYTRKPKESKAKFSGKVIELTGTVKAIATNTNGQPVLYLQVSGDLFGVLCIFYNLEGKLSERVSVGQAVKVKGVWPVGSSVGGLGDCVLVGR